MTTITDKYPGYELLPVNVTERPRVPGDICAGCPSDNEQQSMFDINPNGEGPSSIKIGKGVASICCKVDRLEAYTMDFEWKLLFERKKN